MFWRIVILDKKSFVDQSGQDFCMAHANTDSNLVKL